MTKEVFSNYIKTPIGYLHLQSNSSALLAVRFVERPGENSTCQTEVLTQSAQQLKEYFEGKRNTFELNLAPQGTEFQQKVWSLVQRVNFGQTASYLDIAIRTGSEKNTRAVGMANGKNPIPIIIPCHRIVGSNGKLTGYAGGLERKRWLLHHELENTERIDLLF